MKKISFEEGLHLFGEEIQGYLVSCEEDRKEEIQGYLANTNTNRSYIITKNKKNKYRLYEKYTYGCKNKFNYHFVIEGKKAIEEYKINNNLCKMYK